MREQIEPTNLGEVLACAGIARLAWLHDPTAETGFDGDYFIAPDDVLDGLAPSWKPTASGFELCGLAVDWWESWGMNPALKNWSGNQSPDSVHRESVQHANALEPRQWRSAGLRTGGHLYVDTATGWNTLQLGWSINEHKKDHAIAVRPWLEILASLGLQAMPVSGDRVRGFCYRLWPIGRYTRAIAAFRVADPQRPRHPYYRSRTDRTGKNTYLLPAEHVTSPPNKE